MSLPARRLPPLWSVEETDACFIVRDHNGQALAYVYFEEESGRRAAAKLLTRDEARRIAANIASCLSCLRRSCWHRPRIVPYPLIGQGPSTAAAGLAVVVARLMGPCFGLPPTRTFSRNGGSKDAQMV